MINAIAIDSCFIFDQRALVFSMFKLNVKDDKRLVADVLLQPCVNQKVGRKVMSG